MNAYAHVKLIKAADEINSFNHQKKSMKVMFKTLLKIMTQPCKAKQNITMYMCFRHIVLMRFELRFSASIYNLLLSVSLKFKHHNYKGD